MPTITDTFTFGGMDSVSDPANVGIPDVSLRVQDRAYTQCVDIVNCDVDNDANAIRREGRQLITPTPITAAWGNTVDTFCVTNNLLHTFDGANVNVIGNSPAMLDVVEFCQVNDVVAFSDNNTIGLLEDDIPYVITSPGEAVDLLDLETWVKLTYPAGTDDDASNMEIDAFKIATLAGRCLESYNGAMYLAVDNFIFATRTFNVEAMDIRYNVVAGFSAPVTMIKAVNDGLLVGTEKGGYFLAGDGVQGSGTGVRGFEQRRLFPFGVVYGSAIAIHADKAAALQLPNIGAVWLTSDGVYAGGDGGRYVNLTSNRMAMPAGNSAAAMIHRQGEAWQYIVSVGVTAIAVNLANGWHSRYTNYAFSSFFKRGSQWYGTNPLGVFLLAGDDDAGAQVDAYFVTPVVDFGAYQQKHCPDAYLHARTAGEMIVNLFVDEIPVDGDFPLSAPDMTNIGVRRLRAKLPRGIRGTNWQFRISNVSGCRFTAFSLKVTPTISQRTT